MRVRLKRLRPTQLSVGYGEVAHKAAQWSRLGKKKLAIELAHHVFPGVLGPGHDYFIIDHHHLGIALIDQGVEEVLLAVMDDLSWLKRPVFWAHDGVQVLDSSLRSSRAEAALQRHAASPHRP